MKIKTGRTWKNWAGTSESTPLKIIYPTTIEEVTELVSKAKAEKKKIRVVGAGHSFTHLAHTTDWLLSLDGLKGIESIDTDKETVTVFAGTRLYEIGSLLGEKGYAQENLGDINVQSIAGAVSTGTHGTGLQFGNISTQVLEVTFVSGSGEIVALSVEKDPEFFKACLVSLGMLGIIVKIKLKMIQSPVYVYKSDKVKFHVLEEKLNDYIYNNRHFEFFLFPYTDTVQVKTMNITSEKPQSLRWHKLNSLVLENYLFYVISEVCRIFPKTSAFFSRLSAKAIGKETIRAESHELFATPRKVRFREMEYSIPLAYFLPALREIRQTIEEKKYHVHFPIECRTVKADDIWLSPSYKRDSAYIAFHMYKGMPYDTFFIDMENIMKKYDGRPHWGKMHKRTADELFHLYPRLYDFLVFRQKQDPDDLFLNPYLRQLLYEQSNKQQTIEKSS
ncbi:D-arabinono-1,4-lactone oxidase [Cytobacillus purgationiresistens]|uniref:L-gulonolactone oxidase n=1 Tax=Cytobacillus purgationiresistens TaxID=863449 RepID=A0ABU0APY5_9BACI|nr:D-arabinono-1,4-lactone oxidase [Cytobacillus purgationiresistens]MDQ0273263.1 L-gulonolactone oxidase [Cytobacillus purgationiresistens]